MFCNRVLVLHLFRKFIEITLAKNGADVNRLSFQYSAKAKRIQNDQCQELGLWLGISGGRNETIVFRRKEETGSKKFRSVLRKSRITSAFKLTAPGRHAFCLRKSPAGNASAATSSVGLRPYSQFNAVLYGLK